MKKKIVSLLLLLTLGCTACANTNSVTTENKQEEAVNQEKEETKEHAGTETEEEKKEEKVEITVYYPDEMAENMLTEVVVCDEVTKEVVWELLKEREIISEECDIHTLEQNQTILDLDVNEAFGNQLRSYGTTGEKMMIHCVVNTFLDAFECEQIKITENGEILCSGHREYDDYMTKFE